MGGWLEALGVDGLFFQYFFQSDPRDPIDAGLYLSAAILNQAEITSRAAHFQLLVEALQPIDRSGRAV